MRYFPFLLKSGVYFTPTVHLVFDKPHFKGSVANVPHYYYTG